MNSGWVPNPAALPTTRTACRYTTAKDGKVVTGRRLNEDTYSVQILDDNGRLVTLLKADLKDLQVLTTSLMPSVRGKLNPDEVSDLIAYLISLKG